MSWIGIGFSMATHLGNEKKERIASVDKFFKISEVVKPVIHTIFEDLIQIF